MAITILPVTPVTGSDDPASQISVDEVNNGFQKVHQSASGLIGLDAAGDSIVIPLGTNLSFTGSPIQIDAASGGGSGDLLSTLLNSEVPITSSTTATISKMHVVSGASDWTLTLPAASGNTGKFIGVRVANSYTKLLYLVGNGSPSELIDGAQTRIMWAGETAILLCDGSNWFKIAGRSIPMTIRANRTTDYSTINASTWTAIPLTTQVFGTALMWDSGNSRAKAVRAGFYQATAYTYVSQVTGSLTFMFVSTGVNGTQDDYQSCLGNAGNAAAVYGTLLSLAVNDYVQPMVYQDATTAKILGAGHAYIALQEVLAW